VFTTPEAGFTIASSIEHVYGGSSRSPAPFAIATDLRGPAGTLLADIAVVNGSRRGTSSTSSAFCPRRSSRDVCPRDHRHIYKLFEMRA
jgi:hypothetical protein